MPIKSTMQTFIVFLRGINVSGKNQIKMADLKAKASKEFQHFTTYIQSGNLVFVSDKSQVEVEEELHSLIHEKFKCDVAIFAYELNFIETLPLKNPYLSINNVDFKRLMVTFLKDNSQEDLQQNLLKLKPEDEFLHFDDKLIFSHYPNGIGKAKLNNNFIEQKLKTTATTRNWNTILKMIAIGNEVNALL